MTEALTRDLRSMVLEKQIVAIVGTGVSLATTGRAPNAGWSGLLEDGIRRCIDLRLTLPPDWEPRMVAALNSDLPDILTVAEQIQMRLDAPEFARWLRESIGPLTVQDSTLIKAIASLKIPILTTNYDSLIEDVTGLPHVTWRQSDKVRAILNGREPGVIHMHGYYDEPDSIVFGASSYERVRSNRACQTTLQALATLGNFLFVGCGDGLQDPNFSRLREWMAEALSETGSRNYRLVTEEEEPDLRRVHRPEERIQLLPFGHTFAELAPFLDRLGDPDLTQAAVDEMVRQLSPATMEQNAARWGFESWLPTGGNPPERYGGPFALLFQTAMRLGITTERRFKRLLTTGVRYSDVTLREFRAKTAAVGTPFAAVFEDLLIVLLLSAIRPSQEGAALPFERVFQPQIAQSIKEFVGAPRST